MAESLPPLTLAELNTALTNPHFSTYLFFGEEVDQGWQIAIAAQQTLPGLRVYRVAAERAGEVRGAFNIAQGDVGVCFDFGTSVKEKLARAAAEDFLSLLEALKRARA